MNLGYLALILSTVYGATLYVDGASLWGAIVIALILLAILHFAFTHLDPRAPYQREEKPAPLVVVHKTYKTLYLSHLTVERALKRFREEHCSIPLLIGAGCAGINAIEHLKDQGLSTLAFDTDEQKIQGASADYRIYTKDRESVGAFIAKNRDGFTELLQEAGTVFIIAGLGGKTGTTAARMLARYCHEIGVTAHVCVITPFGLEGRKKSHISDLALKDIRQYTDSVITISNEEAMAQFSDDSRFSDVLAYPWSFLNSIISRVKQECDDSLEAAHSSISV